MFERQFMHLYYTFYRNIIAYNVWKVEAYNIHFWSKKIYTTAFNEGELASLFF